MGKRRKVEEDDGASLDSLLDTMTNVVGILVIVLVVTQLGADSAVKNIQKTIVDDVTMAKTKDDLATALADRGKLQNDLAALQPDSKQFANLLQQLQQQIASQQTMLAQLEQAKLQAEAKAKEGEKMALEAQKQLEENEKQADMIKSEITSAEEQVASLQAVLDQTEERGQLPPKQVYLPHPRPAPEGVKPLYFICANNRVYFIDIDGARETARKKAELIVRTKGLDRDLVNGVDPDRFVDEFHKIPLRDQLRSVEVKVTVPGGRYPRVVFEPLENGGFTIQEIEGVRSRFRTLMGQTDQTKYYARFFVLPDSFEAYVAARNVVTEVDMLAGWNPQNQDWQYTVGLGGPLRLGPPMEDPPPAQPPAGPAKPANVID